MRVPLNLPAGAAPALALLGSLLATPAPAQVFTEFPIPTQVAGSLDITVGPDGNLWFTESGFTANKIGRITPAGVITEFTVPTANSFPLGIVAGPDGNLWFTERNSNKIARITTAGVVTEVPGVPPLAFNSNPQFIATGPDGNLWFTEYNGQKIGRLTTGGVLTEFPVTGGSHPNGITSGPDGNLWFTEYLGNRIGRITTSGTLTEFPVPTADSKPYDIVTGPDGNLWFTEQYGNRIGRITTAATIREFPLPTSPAGSAGLAAGPDGNIWFTESSSAGNRIGRLTTGSAFFAVAPCRVADTRDPDGPFGGPVLPAGEGRPFTFAGRCGVPAEARAVSINVAVTLPTDAGFLSLYPGGTPRPLVSTLNFLPGQTRANNAVVPLSGGELEVFGGLASGSVHVILDVNGYFR